MKKLTAELFSILNDKQVESVLFQQYQQAEKQNKSILWHLLPKLPRLLTKGIDWAEEDSDFYDDKYISIVPDQGTFLYMQARALNAKNIIEFGTSYGISTLYLGKAAKDNGGRVITTENLAHKAAVARQNFQQAGLADYIEVREGDALQTLKNIEGEVDFVLLDGWPDLVFKVFQLLEPHLKKGAVIAVDDVEGFAPSMQDYLDYVRHPKNGYLSTTIKPSKGMEFTVKTA